MGRRTPPSFDFYPDDFVGGTAYLSATEIGVYMILLIHQWHYGHIPDDENWWKRIIGNRMEWTPENRETVGFILEQKFEKKDGKFFNERMASERSKQHKRYRANVENGRKGGRPKRLQDSESENPNKTQGLTQTKPSGKGEVGSRKKQKGKGVQGKGWQPDYVEFPDEISEGFRETWTVWCKHRREIKAPLTPTSVNQQLKRFAEWGEDRATAAILHTIEKGWQGLREPEEAKPKSNPDRYTI